MHGIFKRSTVICWSSYPKTSNAIAIKDYRSISLIHVIEKLFSKVLANKLAPRLGDLVHASQSSFIKGRFTQDNFKFIQASANLVPFGGSPAHGFHIEMDRLVFGALVYYEH
jgi:hypothetical protein